MGVILKRIPFIENGIVKIPLTKGQLAVCDIEDYEKVKDLTWFSSKDYAGRQTYNRITGKQKILFLHHVLCVGKIIDHADGNPLNNMRNNLRSCGYRENNRNRKKGSAGHSQFKGVSFDKKRNRWKAMIHCENKTINIGNFVTEIESAKAYDEKAIIIFEEFARLNFSVGGTI